MQNFFDSIVFSSILLGIVLGCIFAFLFLSCDNRLVKLLIFLMTSGSIEVYKSFFSTLLIGNDVITHRIFVNCLLFATIVTFVMLVVFVIYTGHNKHITFLDILLGQRPYLDKYYSQRCDELKSELNITELENKSIALAKREADCIQREENLRIEEDNITQQLKKRLFLIIPCDKRISIDQKFVNAIPSFIHQILPVIYDVNRHHEQILNENELTQDKLEAYFLKISECLIKHLLKIEEVRVHFRKYNFDTKKFEMIHALLLKNGEIIQKKHLTPVPFNGSMIEKSYNNRRGMIKSLNTDADYRTQHYSKWEDYLTITFPDINYNGSPVLSMGISVTSAESYRELFYFLEYVKFDLFLIEKVEELDSRFGIAKIYYAS